MPSADALNAIRAWIAVGQAATPALGDDLTAGIPDDFVKQRQADSKVSGAVLPLCLFCNCRAPGYWPGFGSLAYNGQVIGANKESFCRHTALLGRSS